MKPLARRKDERACGAGVRSPMMGERGLEGRKGLVELGKGASDEGGRVRIERGVRSTRGASSAWK
jgi:hypothetical protein